MLTQRSVLLIAVMTPLLVGARHESVASITRSAPWSRFDEPDACTLLTQPEVSKALEITSLPGKRIIPSSPKLCMWSDDANNAAANRRATLQLVTISAFQLGKSNSRITTESASGIGDEAYYETFRADSPILAVRKGSTAFHVRILNGLKLKPFTLDQEKSKEADLAKAAVAKLK